MPFILSVFLTSLIIILQGACFNLSGKPSSNQEAPPIEINVIIHEEAFALRIDFKSKQQANTYRQLFQEKGVEIFDLKDDHGQVLSKCYGAYTKLYDEREMTEKRAVLVSNGASKAEANRLHPGYNLRSFFEAFPELKKYINQATYATYKAQLEALGENVLNIA